MGKSEMGNTIRRPRTMVIHLRNTSAQRLADCLQHTRANLTACTLCSDGLAVALVRRICGRDAVLAEAFCPQLPSQASTLQVHGQGQ